MNIDIKKEVGKIKELTQIKEFLSKAYAEALRID